VKKRAKAFRISKRKEIVFLLNSGKRWDCANYSLVFIENDGVNDRAAVIVSRKNGNAVSRNRIKRIYRSLFFKNRCIVPPFFDILIVPAGSSAPPSDTIQSNYETWKKLVNR
jgi:ribonuclease P protein component